MSLFKSKIEQPNTQPEKPKKTQEELREAFEKRFYSLEGTINNKVKEYEEALKNDFFEDQQGEPVGAGDKRREDMQNILLGLKDRAKDMQETLESKEPLPEYSPDLHVEYIYTDPNTKKEYKETINLNIDQKIDDFISFYQSNHIDLPPDFEDSIRDIWEEHYDEIEDAIKQQGFNDMLLMPNDLSLPDLHTKMTEGYNPTYEDSNFTAGGSFQDAKSPNTDKLRIVFAHNAQNLKDRPELKSTLNMKGEDIPMDQTLTLEDYLVFQRKYFKETGKHLDADGWTWLATKSGARFVASGWYPADGWLGALASVGGYRISFLGRRPSRSFFNQP